MRPDPNTAPLAAAARQRSQLTRSKAVQALRELDRSGAPITFEAVARHAGISRSWLYTQPDLRDQIQQLRDVTRPTPGPPIPAHQHASDTSLRSRLAAALERNRKLTAENQRLRGLLADILGEQRAPTQRPAGDGQPRAGSSHRSSITIGPR